MSPIEGMLLIQSMAEAVAKHLKNEFFERWLRLDPMQVVGAPFTRHNR